ncbi:MAG: hypothetical protein JO051_13435 [Acidobacteriaceae bacterium]|nr:hypothetical protein [Acidobacteriaceae bacterium]
METTRLPDRKLEILRSAGYRYNFDRQLYINRAAKKAFSVAFVDDNSEHDIAKLVRDRSSDREWRFFFNEGPSPAVAQELSKMLG